MLSSCHVVNLKLSLIAGLLIACSASLLGQSRTPIPADAKCYVIIGAFNLERNAALFSNYFEQKGVKSSYKKNSYRNMFYVYTFESKDRESTKNRLYKFRDEYPTYHEAWLYAGNFKGPHIPGDRWNKGDQNDEVAKQPESKTSPVVEVSESVSQNEVDITTVNDVSENSSETITAEIKVPEKSTEIVSAPPLDEGTYRVYINSYDAVTLKEVSGTFSIFDTERGKEIKRIVSHNAVVINKPKNATNRITFKSDIFDYRKEEHTIDLDEPLVDGANKVEIIGDSILLDFPLQPFNKGDVMTMWQVYFYIDAAIMKEESIGQLNQLLRMMQSNPKMKIKIHGHTNGNSHGKVLHLSEGDLNFFSIKAGTHEEIQASAKTLSEFRSHTIEQWLTDQGIDEGRLEAIGWGGKKMIYDKHDTQAHKNVRVEIEIVEE